MELNEFIFPAPKPTYNVNTYSTLVWIPRVIQISKKQSIDQPEEQISSPQSQQLTAFNTINQPFSEVLLGKASKKTYQEAIPCNYNQPKEGSDIILIYFHGNAEDLGMGTNFTRELSEGLKLNVLAVEYPGYGVYQGIPNAKTILEDAVSIFDFLVFHMKINSQKIFLFGRSIGSGPATYLAAHRNPGMLVLLSAYTSIRDLVRSKIGSFAQFLVADRFRNIDEIQKVKSPCFFIHGSRDTLVPSSHTIELFNKCKALSGLSIRKDMSHNQFNMKKDIINPILGFFGQIGHKHSSGKLNLPSSILSKTLLQEDSIDCEEETRIQRANISSINPNYLVTVNCGKNEEQGNINTSLITK